MSIAIKSQAQIRKQINYAQIAKKGIYSMNTYENLGNFANNKSALDLTAFNRTTSVTGETAPLSENHIVINYSNSNCN